MSAAPCLYSALLLLCFLAWADRFWPVLAGSDLQAAPCLYSALLLLSLTAWVDRFWPVLAGSDLQAAPGLGLIVGWTMTLKDSHVSPSSRRRNVQTFVGRAADATGADLNFNSQHAPWHLLSFNPPAVRLNASSVPLTFVSSNELQTMMMVTTVPSASLWSPDEPPETVNER